VKVAAVLSLPFHRWILADTVAALRALGVEVEEFEHVPQHAHDWISGNNPLLKRLGQYRPDAVLAADYPYEPLIVATGATLFATRHSLAARGNTYAPEQRGAHYLATFGEWDERLLGEHGIVPYDHARVPQVRLAERIRVGCPWAGPLLAASPLAGPGLRAKPVVAWCPTWNDWSPDIADELASLQPDVQVVYRPHYATAWRNPAALDRAAKLGFTIDDPLAHPANLLLQADVLVGDVSGIVLLALAVPGAALPIVQVEPPVATLAGQAQFESWGPEWKWRDRIGTRATPGNVRGAVIDYLGSPREGLRASDEDEPNRRILRRVIFGADPLPGGLTPGQRLANEIVNRAE
jgi:hypothetical protein